MNNNNNGQRSVQIHQLLYGYKDGHRLLSGSTKPVDKSARTLLALSDLSGQGGVVEEKGYITGYPLPHMRAYAFAITWLALEMPRPGCVWTHTILIDFSDLACIEDTSFLKLFRRPLGLNDIHAYSKPLTVQISPSKERICNNHLIKPMTHLLKAIYESPQKSIFAQAQSNIPAEELCLAVWLQQWPRLRRSFRFCTWSSSDRSRGNERFDLQFIPYKRNFNHIKSKGSDGQWVDVLAPMLSTNESWVEFLLEDNFLGDRKNELRKFLWRYGAEIKEGRIAFKPLVQLWQQLERSPRVNLGTAIKAVNEIIPTVNSLSLRVLDEILKSYRFDNCLSSFSIEFLVENLIILDANVNEDYLSVIAAAIWEHSPDQIWNFFYSDSAVQQAVASAAALIMTPLEALKGVAGDAHLFCRILEANPKLAYSSLVWEATEPIPTCSAEILSKNCKLDSYVLCAMLKAENKIIPQIGVKAFAQDAVNEAIKYYENDNIDAHNSARDWLLEAKKFPILLLTSVSQGRVKFLETLSFISTLVDFRSVPVLEIGDEWVEALNSVKGNVKKCDISFYYFMIGRALSGVSPDPLPLIHFSLATVYRDLVRSYRETNRWLLLTEILPEVPPKKKWDRAYRLRRGLLKFFCNQDLSPQYFFGIFDDRNDFKKMVDEASLFSEGRDYLEKVDSWVKDHGGNDVYPWNTFVESALRPPRKIFSLLDLYFK